MSNTVIDSATQSSVKYIGDIVSAISEIIKERIRRKETKDEYKLHKIDAKKQAQLYKEMTENFTKMPQRITYPVSESKLALYVIDELQEYNRTHKTRIPYEVHQNSRGQYEIITSTKGVEKCYDLRIKYAIERGGKVGEISTDKFDTLANGQHVTVLKGITEEQYNYISRKTWNNRNDISYTALKNPDGTYNVAVISQDYMAYSRKSDDIYTALVAEKMTYDKIRQDADKYEAALEEKVFTYDKKEPMYITSTRSSSQYMKVEMDKVVIMRPDGEDITIRRPGKDATDEEKKNFAIDIYSQLDRISEPMIIGEKTMEKLTKDGTKIEDALDAHARSGKDSDLVIGQDDNGIDIYERPIADSTKGYRNQKQLAINTAHIFRDKLCYNEAMLVVGPYIEIYENAIAKDSHLSDGVKDHLRENLGVMIVSKTAEIADGELPTMTKSQLDKTIGQTMEVTLKGIELTPDEKNRIQKITEKVNKEVSIRDPKDILTKDKINEIKDSVVKQMKEEMPKIVTREIEVKDLVGYSKNFATTMQSIGVTEGSIDRAIDTAASVYEMTKESLYITPDQGLYETLENGLSDKEKAEFRNTNRIHDDRADAKMHVAVDKMTGTDTIRSTTSEVRKHNDYEEREETDTIEERSLI